MLYIPLNVLDKVMVQLFSQLKKLLWILFLIVVIAPWVILCLTAYLVLGIIFTLAMWFVGTVSGRDTVFVYSESPNWEKHVKEHIIPKIAQRSFILNWSERRLWNQWTSLPILIFNFFGGSRCYNPIAIVFRPLRLHKTFRFFEAFRDYKHGNPQSLEDIESEFFKYLG